MTSVRSPYRASATPRFTVEVVLPTPPFWLAIVMTRIRLGGGNGSWSAACSTRVARSASIAMGLSKSAIPEEDGEDAWSAARLLRSRSPGSVIAGPSCSAVRRSRAVSRGTGSGGCTCSTWNSGRTPSPCSTRHDHHGSGSIPEVCADGPRMNITHTRRLEFGHHPGKLGQGARTDQSNQLRTRSQETTAPADQAGERCDRPGRHHVHRPDRGDHRPLLGQAAHDPPGVGG